MPALNYQDMNVSVSWNGDFHIQLRTLDTHLNKTQIAALIYPVFDAQEKALHVPSPPTSPAPSSDSST